MSYVAERREEEKERRRAEMVDAAEELYAKVGWDAVTMDRVAKSARLSRALLYVYFRDKNDLLHAITERSLLELRERFVAAAATHQKGIDQVQAIGRSYVQFQQEMPYRFDACSRFHAHQAEGYPAEDACAAAGDAVMAVIVGALRQGQADGTIRKDIGDPMQVCVTLWAFTHGLIQLATNKRVEIAHHGVDIPQLMEGSFGMLRYMLAAKPGT
jgi:AcrR family transcriptional regulator